MLLSRAVVFVVEGGGEVGEMYGALNYVAKNALANLDISLLATNVLDNTSPIGMVINNGVFHPRGRGLGFQLSRRF